MQHGPRPSADASLICGLLAKYLPSDCLGLMCLPYPIYAHAHNAAQEWVAQGVIEFMSCAFRCLNLGFIIRGTDRQTDRRLRACRWPLTVNRMRQKSVVERGGKGSAGGRALKIYCCFISILFAAARAHSHLPARSLSNNRSLSLEKGLAL